MGTEDEWDQGESDGGRNEQNHRVELYSAIQTITNDRQNIGGHLLYPRNRSSISALSIIFERRSISSLITFLCCKN